MPAGSRITVWCYRGSVVAVLDDQFHRHNTITLNSPDGDIFKRLTELGEADEWMDQIKFIRLLKTDLYGCVPADFIEFMRQLKFSASSEGEGNIVAGRESLGVSVNREALAGGKAIPDTVKITCPVYKDLIDGESDWDVYRAEIVCTLTVDYGGRQLKLEPIPDELVRAKREADEWIYAKMKAVESDMVRVYCGFPT